MRIGVMMCAFREHRLIVPAIHQFDETGVEEIVVACSQVPWSGLEKEPDDTVFLAAEAGATVRRFPWKTEADQKNWIQEKLSKMDWIIMAAPDMYLTKDSINNLIEGLKRKQETDPLYEEQPCYGCKMLTYWKDYEHVIAPEWDFKSVAVRPSYRFWSSAVVVANQYPNLENVVMHHISWVKSDEEVYNKITTYHHAPEIGRDWFENVWKKWDERMFDFGPTVPENFKTTIKGDFPQELRQLINTYERPYARL